MSLIEIGITNGFVEKQKDCLIIYPKRIIHAGMLKHVVQEAIDMDYVTSDEISYNRPIVMKKKNKIDVTELFVKLYVIKARYGINEFKVDFVSDTVIKFFFMYKNKPIEKTFDVELLCVMEQDFILAWLEERLQQIDAEIAGDKNE